MCKIKVVPRWKCYHSEGRLFEIFLHMFPTKCLTIARALKSLLFLLFIIMFQFVEKDWRKKTSQDKIVQSNALCRDTVRASFTTSVQSADPGAVHCTQLELNISQLLVSVYQKLCLYWPTTYMNMIIQSMWRLFSWNVCGQLCSSMFNINYFKMFPFNFMVKVLLNCIASYGVVLLLFNLTWLNMIAVDKW